MKIGEQQAADGTTLSMEISPWILSIAVPIGVCAIIYVLCVPARAACARARAAFLLFWQFFAFALLRRFACLASLDSKKSAAILRAAFALVAVAVCVMRSAAAPDAPCAPRSLLFKKEIMDKEEPVAKTKVGPSRRKKKLMKQQ